ncbi:MULTISPECIES: hypothetical protein [unclassified Halomonas]|uniref:hypothetical protein n=1 Tax=unclassified Halomonas TaxID=2609666 RepID=UPI00209EED71|nr:MULTISPECIES: hypothetical protein [unclassified Halomonas]MCP1313297.1 hypothetical protein [Halomonas sp. 707D7]MCP1327100.1 hypothetical protein [Halomonas sp. 707D4]
MQLIQTGKYSRVHFDAARDLFIKTFQPKRFDRLRYLLRIRPYPGRNFSLVAARLEALGIATPTIVEARPYRLVTKNIHGVALRERILDSPALQDQYLDALIAFDRHGIHCRGLHTGNFLVRDETLFAIDLDAYKLPRLVRYSRREYLDCLSRSLAGDEAFLFTRLLDRLGLDEQYRPRP